MSDEKSNKNYLYYLGCVIVGSLLGWCISKRMVTVKQIVRLVLKSAVETGTPPQGGTRGSRRKTSRAAPA